MAPDPGPDAAGANNLFVVEPRGWYAMMSLHAPAMRPKLVDADPIEVNWHGWIARLTGQAVSIPVSCHSRITGWVASIEGYELNQYANIMFGSLAVNNGIRPLGNVVFTGYNPILDTISGLDGEQFGVLAAAYRRAAQRVSPALYGRDVEV